MDSENVNSSAVLKILKDMLNDNGINHYKINIYSSEEMAQSFTGLIVPVKVNDCDTSIEHNFIMKCAPKKEELRDLIFMNDVYEREIHIYSKLLPEFDKIQQERNISNAFHSYPKYYTSSEKYKEEVIILENMLASSYKHWDENKSTEIDHLFLIVRELGKLHALSYVIRKQQPKVFATVIGNMEEKFFKNFANKSMRDTTQLYVSRALDSLDPVNDKIVYEKFKRFSEDLHKIIGKAVDSKNADQYAVVNHGDCGFNNLLFKYEDFENSSKPTSACFVDWQRSIFGSPALDLSSFLLPFADKYVQERHYHNLINEYYASLCSMLNQFEEDNETIFPFAELQNQLKMYSVFGLFTSTMIVFLQNYKTKSVLDFAVTSNNTKKIEDLVHFHLQIRDIILYYNDLNYNFWV
ncbi:hypothetical protein FQA39_LY13834 [Lamprigera yunnana]|nr:hypothetical protein FQA39_LY13834 [Lamprigera yunnana]